jgi:hypothetical protein
LLSTKEVLANLAGYFDGEGCVHMSNPNPAHRSGTQLIIKVASADKEVLDRFSAVFGGKVRPIKSVKRQQWRWAKSGNEAQRVLKLLLPYLTAKRFPALAALAPKFGKSGGSTEALKLTEDERKRREWAMNLIHSFNNRVTVIEPQPNSVD